jgi:hypothetical protein
LAGGRLDCIRGGQARAYTGIAGVRSDVAKTEISKNGVRTGKLRADQPGPEGLMLFFTYEYNERPATEGPDHVDRSVDKLVRTRPNGRRAASATVL